MKRLALFLMLVLISAFIASCGGSTSQSNSPSTNQSPNGVNTNATTANTNQPSYTVPGSSPTATIKAWREALRKKDAEAFSKTYAKADVDAMNEGAKADGLALNAWIKKGYFDNPNFANMFPPTLEVSNEQIKGDTATLSIKNKQGRMKTAIVTYDGGMIYGQARLYFVKENGEWKLSPKNAPPFTEQEQLALDQELLDDMPPE